MWLAYGARSVIVMHMVKADGFARGKPLNVARFLAIACSVRTMRAAWAAHQRILASIRHELAFEAFLSLSSEVSQQLPVLQLLFVRASKRLHKRLARNKW